MDPKQQIILWRLQQIARINPRGEATDRALAHAREKLSELVVEPAKPWRTSTQQKPFFWSKLMIPRIAGLVLGGFAVIGVILLLMLPIGQGQIAFAQVVEKIRQTRSVLLKVKVEMDGFPTEIQNVLILSDGKIRSDTFRGYAIADVKARKAIFVDKQSKKVHVTEGFVQPDSPTGEKNIYEMIRNIQNNSVERLPDEEIEGRKAMVFKGAYGGTELMKIWIDPQTALPFRMESEPSITGSKEPKVLIYDMVFDQSYDPSLFDMKLPEGYAVETRGTAQLADLPDNPELSAPLLKPGEGMGAVKFSMSKGEVIKLIGEPEKSVNKGGYWELEYYSRGYTLIFTPQGVLFSVMCSCQRVHDCQIRDFAGKTKEGIGIGSTIQDLEKTYGKPDSIENRGVVQSLLYKRLGIGVDLIDNKVVCITLNRRTRNQATTSD
jgi:hypothetical protein